METAGLDVMGHIFVEWLNGLDNLQHIKLQKHSTFLTLKQTYRVPLGFCIHQQISHKTLLIVNMVDNVFHSFYVTGTRLAYVEILKEPGAVEHIELLGEDAWTPGCYPLK